MLKKRLSSWNERRKSGVARARFTAAGRRSFTNGRASCTNGRILFFTIGYASRTNGRISWFVASSWRNAGRRSFSVGRSRRA